MTRRPRQTSMSRRIGFTLSPTTFVTCSGPAATAVAALPSLRPLVDDDPPRGVQIHTVLVAVLARHGEVALRLHSHGDNLAAWQSLKRDHRRQVLLQRLVISGKQWRGEDRDHEQRSDECHGAFVHKVPALRSGGRRISSRPRADPRSPRARTRWPTPASGRCPATATALSSSAGRTTGGAPR